MTLWQCLHSNKNHAGQPSNDYWSKMLSNNQWIKHVLSPLLHLRFCGSVGALFAFIQSQKSTCCKCKDIIFGANKEKNTTSLLISTQCNTQRAIQLIPWYVGEVEYLSKQRTFSVFLYLRSVAFTILIVSHCLYVVHYSSSQALLNIWAVQAF